MLISQPRVAVSVGVKTIALFLNYQKMPGPVMIARSSKLCLKAGLLNCFWPYIDHVNSALCQPFPKSPLNYFPKALISHRQSQLFVFESVSMLAKGLSRSVFESSSP